MSFNRQLDDSVGEAVRNESVLHKEPRAYSTEQPMQDLSLGHWNIEMSKTDAVILAC